ncbi:MAG: tRNA (adenosine(37)-N6)-dimethylallyltransferase MiaA [Anaerobutyricum sp.]|nr:tRNA (adenosine(37)-N6)-dimethylallyltransferase MiaA [Eubacterium sp.]MDY6046073.1 tRNA (adenosine(37)-N6)-dimethylallyltransferase MiaA [Anaerobutyricum sp.]
MKNRNESEKKPLIVLTGPTAVGKTNLSIRLAKKIGGEIISADSMQIYKKMNIGTAKISPEEMAGVPHYLVDELDPGEEFNVVAFQQMAKKAMKQIYENGHIPIVVGGTGFYIQALLYDVDFSEHETEEKYRQELVALEQEKGREYLYEMLKQADPEYAAIVHSNNVKRVIRALEYYHETGRKLSEHNAQQRENSSPYQFVYLVLNDEREILYDRIDRRVDQMMEAGLLQEVEALVKEGYERTLVSMQGLGYKEFFDYFDGKCTLEETVDIIKRDTRRFAKRQLTWFRREKEVCWMNKQDYPDGDALFHEILKILKEKEIWNG